MNRVLFSLFLLILFTDSYSQHRISGHVFYANPNSVALDSTVVILMQGTTQVKQTSADIYGFYHLDSIPDGIYTITATTSKHWGGVNSTDAYKVLLYFLRIDTMTSIQQLASNVDTYSQINAMDAFLIQKRFIQSVTSFPVNDWAIEPENITMTGQNIVVNLKALCRGDVDGSFNPPSSFTCGNALVDSRDGQSYSTIQIGNQCWMSKNLNIGTFVYGVGNQENNGIIEKYCYSNITSNCTAFGGLYQWREMMQYDTTPGIQGICPLGWHIPTDPEWGILINQFGGSSAAGIPLQAGGSSGFNALLGGWVYNCSKFRQMNYQGYYWSSTQYWGLYGMARMFTLQSGSITNPYKSKDDGMYVRCVKD